MTPTILTIKRHVSKASNITVKQMDGQQRGRDIVRPRQIAMYLAATMTHNSLASIGRMFGGRDHTTVMHAVRKIGELSAHDPAFGVKVDEIRRTMPINLEAEPDIETDDLDEAARAAHQQAVKRAKEEPGRTVSGPPNDLRKALYDLFGERIVSRGTSRDGGGVELLASVNGTWTMIEVTDDASRARMVASGNDWAAQVEPDKTASPAAPAAAQPSKEGERTCLKCRQPFWSSGPENQICKPCGRSNRKVDAMLAEGMSA